MPKNDSGVTIVTPKEDKVDFNYKPGVTKVARMVDGKIVFDEVPTQDLVVPYCLANDIKECLNEPYHEDKLAALPHNDYTEFQAGSSYADAVNAAKAAEERAAQSQKELAYYNEQLALAKAKEDADKAAQSKEVK